MPTFIVRDATGRIKLDLSQRLTKVIGVTTTTPGFAGSIRVVGYENGNIWYSATPAVNESLTRFTSLSVNVNSGVISWGASPRAYTIMWGIY